MIKADALSINYQSKSYQRKALKFSKHSTDEELVQGCRKGKRLAQKVLYERYFGKMMGIAMRYAKDQEEGLEILNAAFLKVFTSLDKYKAQGNLAGWIARIVFNASIDHVRRLTTYRKVMDFNVEREAPIQNEAIDNLHTEDLFQLIQQLPAATRTVFNLYVVEGYKHHEIGDMLKISEGTSKWHLSEARKQLRKLIKQQNLQETSIRY